MSPRDSSQVLQKWRNVAGMVEHPYHFDGRVSRAIENGVRKITEHRPAQPFVCLAGPDGSELGKPTETGEHGLKVCDKLIGHVLAGVLAQALGGFDHVTPSGGVLDEFSFHHGWAYGRRERRVRPSRARSSGTQGNSGPQAGAYRPLRLPGAVNPS